MATKRDPLEQLGIVHEELIRQRESTAEKHRTMHQRASLLIGAATVVTGVQAARFPSAIGRIGDLLDVTGWATPTSVLALIFAGSAAVFALASAILGIVALRVERGTEIDVYKLALHALDGKATPYAVEWSLVRDKIGVHLGDVERLEGRRKVFMSGAALLVVSWMLAVAHFSVSFG